MIPSPRTKSADAIAAIEIVQRATEHAMKRVIDYIHTDPQPTAEGAHQIIDEVFEAEDCESPEGHIVAGGVQSAEPHAPGTGAFIPGQPIVIDIYPRSKATGYFADMSRTVCIGEAPEELVRMFDTVREAQDVGISMLRPGADCKAIQDAVEKVFTDAGYITSGTGTEFKFAEGFVHGVGHGVGFNVHEAPHIGRSTTDVLKEGDVVTVEPGLYYNHIGGVRLEDMLVITKDGARNLTQFPRSLT